MVSEASVLKAVRAELGDQVEPVRDTFRGDGLQVNWDLSSRNLVEGSIQVVQINTEVQPRTTEVLDPTTDYLLDPLAGEITFITPPPEATVNVITGRAYGIFSDDELLEFLHAAIDQHLGNRTVDRRYVNGRGFIQYDRTPMELEDLPAREKILITLLTTIEALWALATDASLDIDVQTAEGTGIPRSQRYRQITAQIDLLTDKYKDLSLMMGVGLYAPEISDLRRVSRTTGRYVPIFQGREYDENGPSIRKNIPINTRGSDPDGAPNPFYSGTWGH